jgi:hypothetical protein
MSILDDENILIENTKYGIDNPFYLLFNSFDSSELVYNVMEELGADKKYYKCEKIRSDKWLLSIRNWNHIGKKGNIGVFTIDKFDNCLLIYFAAKAYIINAVDLLSKKYRGTFTFSIDGYTLTYEP